MVEREKTLPTGRMEQKLQHQQQKQNYKNLRNQILVRRRKFSQSWNPAFMDWNLSRGSVWQIKHHRRSQKNTTNWVTIVKFSDTRKNKEKNVNERADSNSDLRSNFKNNMNFFLCEQ